MKNSHISGRTCGITSTHAEVSWTKPSDVDISRWDFQVTSQGEEGAVGSYHPGGFQVVLADGSVRFIDAATPPDTLRAMTTPAGGEASDVDW